MMMGLSMMGPIMMGPSMMVRPSGREFRLDEEDAEKKQANEKTI